LLPGRSISFGIKKEGSMIQIKW